MDSSGLKMWVLRTVAPSLLNLLIPILKDLGVFIPAPMSQGMRSDFFLEGPFMPPRMKLDRDPLGGLADMFGQMPGMLRLLGWSDDFCTVSNKNYNRVVVSLIIQVVELVLVQGLFRIDFHPPWDAIVQTNFSMAMGVTSYLLLNPSLEN